VIGVYQCYTQIAQLPCICVLSSLNCIQPPILVYCSTC